jgi:UDP-N-acetylglucosamine 2-epimerase
VQRIAIVYGTRPEAIKMAPVVQALRQRPEQFEVVVCATAQHRELLDQAQELFGLRPDHDLNLMTSGQELNPLAARALSGIDQLLAATAPDWLLVQGDTTTAAIAALAAFHRGVRIGHVEAGLRSGDLTRPFPEEANRRIVDLLADALFAPTAHAARRLLEEGAAPARVHLTGNTGIDALYQVAANLAPDAPQAAAGQQTGGSVPAGEPAGEVLVTVHRRESFGAPLAAIFAALRRLAESFPHIRWVYPVHPNPAVSGPAAELLAGLPNLYLRRPLAYDELVRHLRRALLVLTDSGGLQEEAPAFGSPVLVLRDVTERPEGIAAGVAMLVGTDPERIFAATSRLLNDPAARRQMAAAANPYGDGHAALRIAAILAGEPYQAFAPAPRG